MGSLMTGGGTVFGGRGQWTEAQCFWLYARSKDIVHFLNVCILDSLVIGAGKARAKFSRSRNHQCQK